MAWDFSTEPEFAEKLEWMEEFVRGEIIPLEVLDLDAAAFERATAPLKEEVKARGLWAAHLPPELGGGGFGQVRLGLMHEILGQCVYAPPVFGNNAPDSGNAELLALGATVEQKKQWLEPLLDGRLRSAFSMTEPGAGADPTLLATRAERDGDEYVINGHKWFTSNGSVADFLIVMCVTNPDVHPYAGSSMILVPADATGITVHRPLSVFGYDDAPHGHMDITLENVRVPVSNMLLGEGRGFEIAQGRLGPGRIHHCMRLIGLAERALELMSKRTLQRVAFGKPIAAHGVTQERIAEARIMIEQARLLTLKAAYMMDTVGNKGARGEIAMIKVVAPNIACQIIDWAIQAHGAGGVSDDFPLAYAYAHARTLRLADGPDEVHRNAIAKLELSRYA